MGDSFLNFPLLVVAFECQNKNKKRHSDSVDETMAARLCLYFVDQRQLAVGIQTPIFGGQGPYCLFWIQQTIPEWGLPSSQMPVKGLGVVEDRQLLLHKRLTSTNIDNLPDMFSSGSFKCLKRL